MSNKILIHTPLNDLSRDDWPRRQKASVDRVLGNITILAFGITDGVPWIEIPSEELDKLSGISFEMVEAVIAPGAEPEPEPVPDGSIYLHIALSGGDGMDPIGVVNDGVSSIHVDAAFRAGPDQGAALLPVTGQWRINIRNSHGEIYDIILVSFTDGVAAFDYTTTARAAICQILESDLSSLIDLGGLSYGIELVGNAEFKVYRDLTGGKA